MSALAAADELAGSLVPDLQDQFLAKFVVKNLDTGETFHVDQIESFLRESSLLTFEGASASGGWSVAIPEVKQFGGGGGEGGGKCGASADGEDSSAGRGRSSSSGGGGGGGGGGTGGSAMKPFTAYKIFVTNPAIVKDRRTFSMFRRYSEFCKLDRQLRDGGWGECIKLNLPNKRWFNNLSKTVVKQRQEALQAYLNAVLHYVSPEKCAPLNDFFSQTVSNPAGHLLSPPLSPTAEPRLMTLAEATVQFGLLPPPQHEKAAKEASAARSNSACAKSGGLSFGASASSAAYLFGDVSPSEGLFD
jgi:hypothetical protein